MKEHEKKNSNCNINNNNNNNIMHILHTYDTHSDWNEILPRTTYEKIAQKKQHKGNQVQ